MEIANRPANRVQIFLFKLLASRFIKVGLLICLVLIVPVSGQLKSEPKELIQAQIEFDNGNFRQAIDFATVGVEKSEKINSDLFASKAFNIIASSQISMGNYSEAANTLNKSLEKLAEHPSNSYQKAVIYLHYAWLFRSQYKFREALEYSKKAVAIAPGNLHIQGEHYLNFGRILFASGYDISAIIWLEKAEKIFENENVISAKLDTYKYLTLVWWSRLNYPVAIKYGEKWVSSAENTQFKSKHRQALFELAGISGASGQKQKAFAGLEKGLKLSLSQNNSNQSRNFLNSLLLHSLYNNDVKKASDYLQQLERLDSDHIFSFEILLGKAVIAAFRGQHEISENFFKQLDKMEKSSEFILPFWKITIAKRNQDWQLVIKLNQNILELAIKQGFREDLPGIYLNFAKAYFHLNQSKKSLENLEKSLSFIEEIRKSKNQNLSLDLYETYHDAYRLLTQLKSGDTQESFEIADFLKARFLADKISNSVFKAEMQISPTLRQKLEGLSEKFINDPSVSVEIEQNEKLVTNEFPKLNLEKPNLTELDKRSDLNDTAIISYFFTLDKKLTAFVWEKDKPLKTVNLPVTEIEVESDANLSHQKIKNFLFFKRDGKAIYDKLLKPITVSAKHLIIVPDKSLWKIPFQALSPDGKKYLIEEKLISYSPSISILVNELRKPKPNRQSFQAFANSTFENKFLQYVNSEATGVSDIYNTKPILNATITDFEKVSSKSDINHFSMHAQVDNEQPLNSFLAFRKTGNTKGKLTVGEILEMNLKKGSLAFLASCDTTNVFNGEGLVSLSWAMMGAGATTVVSAQWEANDKSTQEFAKVFYENYKQGISSVEAVQKASIALIENKSNNMHEPYYWAEFTLSGDFR